MKRKQIGNVMHLLPGIGLSRSRAMAWRRLRMHEGKLLMLGGIIQNCMRGGPKNLSNVFSPLFKE